MAEGARSKPVIFDGWCPVCGGVHGRNLHYVDKAVIAVPAPQVLAMLTDPTAQ